jgi:thiamine-phosphate pyrophosphorylase
MTDHKKNSEYIKPQIPEGIYGITAENFSNGKTNTECVREMLEAGIKVIQYREKYKTKQEKLKEAGELKSMCSDFGSLLIVNDDIDVAKSVDADGLHLGQDDLPLKEARKLFGEKKIIGISTHSRKQAEEAVSGGADYIGVGPLFATKTKDDVCDPVGLEYLEYAVKNITVPFVAIGGIKLHNIHEVINRGAKHICLVSEITGAQDIQKQVKKINKKIIENQIKEIS